MKTIERLKETVKTLCLMIVFLVVVLLVLVMALIVLPVITGLKKIIKKTLRKADPERWVEKMWSSRMVKVWRRLNSRAELAVGLPKAGLRVKQKDERKARIYV